MGKLQEWSKRFDVFSKQQALLVVEMQGSTCDQIPRSKYDVADVELQGVHPSAHPKL